MATTTDPECLYAKSHEWVRVEGDIGTVGITDYAQSSLSDIVYVELPQVGDTIAKGDTFGVVESVKAASDVFLPVSGEVVAVNSALESAPESVNADPYGSGWFIKCRISDATQLGDLLSAVAYLELVAEEEG